MLLRLLFEVAEGSTASFMHVLAADTPPSVLPMSWTKETVFLALSPQKKFKLQKAVFLFPSLYITDRV